MIIFFVPALFDVQRLENSTNPLGFYGVVMGLLSASYQQLSFSRNSDFEFSRPSSSFGLHLLDACVFPLGGFFNGF